MRGFGTAKFSLKEDFERFCNDAREHNIQVRGTNDDELSVTISDPTEHDQEIVEQYNGSLEIAPDAGSRNDGAAGGSVRRGNLGPAKRL